MSETALVQQDNITPLRVPRGIVATMAETYDMDPKRFEQTIRKTVFPADGGNEELAAFLIVAKQYDLNPLTKEIYAFKTKGGGIQPIVSIDGWCNLINSHHALDGIEFDDHVEGDEVVAITARIWRKDRAKPIVVTEYLAECKKGTEPWKQWPRRMLRHKALIQCARYAFGFAGIVDPDEAERMGADVSPMRDVSPRLVPPAPPEPPKPPAETQSPAQAGEPEVVWEDETPSVQVDTSSPTPPAPPVPPQPPAAQNGGSDVGLVVNGGKPRSPTPPDQQTKQSPVAAEAGQTSKANVAAPDDGIPAILRRTAPMPVDTGFTEDEHSFLTRLETALAAVSDLDTLEIELRDVWWPQINSKSPAAQEVAQAHIRHHERRLGAD